MSPNRILALLATSLLLTGCFETSSSQSAGTEGETSTSSATDEASSSTNGTTSDDNGTDTRDEPASTGSASTETGDEPPADDTGDPTAAEDTGGITDTEDTDGFACAEEETCTPGAPSGWSGPAVVHRGENPPECPSEFPLDGFTAHDQLVANDASCTCSCGDADGFSCSTTVRENAQSCVNLYFGASWSLAGGQCTTISTSSTAMRSDAATLDLTGASCPEESSENVPEAQFSLDLKGCEPPRVPAACEDDGLCLPAPAAPYGELCVYTEGDVACPAGPYSERSVAYTGIDDTRGCTDCTCDTPTGTCGGTVRYISGCGGGLGVLHGQTPPGDCISMNSSPAAVSYTPDPDLSCQASGGVPEGEANPADPITLCCMP
jgi:hypothetical protein